MTHHFDPEVAVKLGINGAIIIANLAYLQRNREAQGGEKYFIDGRWWVHHTYESLQKVHPYFSLDQLRRTMKKLLDERAVFRSQPDSWNRDSYWSVAPEFMQSAESPDRSGEIAGSQGAKSPVVLHDNKHRTTTPCSPPSKIPVQQIVDLYHEILPANPRVVKITPARRSLIKQRWNDELKTLDNWRNYFEHVAQSKFLTGRAVPQSGKPVFFADLEWLVRQSNLVKVAEGKYHREVTNVR